ncbi:hypothetical protein OIU78_003423 [Salix suchowensis]|nr:hypothetical protein OIU78_003423 [Salix suchowensis]
MESEGAKPEFKKGLWKPEEDLILKAHVETHGEGNWSAVSKRSGAKRKTIDSELDQNDEEKQNKSKRLRSPTNSQPTCNAIAVGSAEELEGKKRPENEGGGGAVSDAWIQRDAQSMNYYIESPMMLDNNATTFVYEDEPFLDYWDSFVMFESLDFGGDW